MRKRLIGSKTLYNIRSVQFSYFYLYLFKYTLEKTEVVIKNGQCKETVNIRYISHRTKKKKNSNKINSGN